MIFDTQLIGLLGYSGYLAVIAGIAYDRFRYKTADGVQVDDITSSVGEAKKSLDEFLNVVLKVIDNPAINDKDTIVFIKNAIEKGGK